MAGFEICIYIGITAMALAVLLFTAGSARFLIKRKSIGRKLDEEYGNPQKYKSRQEGTITWPQ